MGNFEGELMYEKFNRAIKYCNTKNAIIAMLNHFKCWYLHPLNVKIIIANSINNPHIFDFCSAAISEMKHIKVYRRSLNPLWNPKIYFTDNLSFNWSSEYGSLFL
jgi:hypothetical protein